MKCCGRCSPICLGLTILGVAVAVALVVHYDAFSNFDASDTNALLLTTGPAVATSGMIGSKRKRRNCC
ncbi:MAG: hypothetical protein VYC34_09775 [Planctomycetota bacterium]|nr:hypothetical protein [Planctomycetota bacterium]